MTRDDIPRGSGVLLSVRVGMPQTLGDPASRDFFTRAWTTGSFKTPVSAPVYAGTTNLAGDGQADSENHGGVHKAVCVYPSAHYDFWRVELGVRDFPFGAFGENVTVGGLAEDDVCIGDVWRAGDTRFEVSQPRQPCWKLARRWGIKDLAYRVQESGRMGWYFRVVTEGLIAPGMRLTLERRLFPQWTVAKASEVMRDSCRLAADAEALANVPALSPSWRATLLAPRVRDPRGRLEGEPMPK